MVPRNGFVETAQGRAAVLTLGIFYILAAAGLTSGQVIFETPLTEVTFFGVLVAIPGAVLLYGGYRLPGTEINPVHYKLISKWCYGAVLTIVAIITFYHFLPPDNVSYYPRTVLVISAFVLVPAFIAGVNAASARSRADELARAHDLLARTEETANVGGWEIDPKTEDVYWTDQLYHILGWSPDDTPTLEEALALYTEEDRPRVESAVEAAIEDDETFDLEVQFERPSGEVRWLRIQGRPDVRNGDVVSLRGAAQDITARKCRELELEKYEAVTEAANDVIVTIDEEQVIDTINSKVTEVFGYSPSELEGESVTKLMSENFVDAHTAGFNRYLETGERNLNWDGIEFEGQRADGQSIPLAVTICEIEHAGERFFSGILRDITEQKEREAELQRVRNRMEYALTATDSIVWDWNVEEDSASFYPSEESLYGQTVDTWDDFIDLIHPDDRDSVREGIEKAIANDEAKSEEIRIVRNGETRWIHAPGKPVRDDDGTLRMVGVARDITERKEYEQKLKESNERLEQFAYAASHDLQEPLRMVSSYLQLIERRYGDTLGDVGNEFLEYAVDGADRMRAMINGLLQYSRVDTEGMSLEPVDLNEVLDDTLTDLAMHFDDSGADVEVEELPEVFGDEHQLRQVFQNLLHNAVQYSGEEPPDIRVSAERNGSDWIVSVHDDGIGIDPADQERIFDIFERLHSQDGPGGSGIGLALCQRIIERHNGELWVESARDEGATFSVTLQDPEAMA